MAGEVKVRTGWWSSKSRGESEREREREGEEDRGNVMIVTLRYITRHTPVKYLVF